MNSKYDNKSNWADRMMLELRLEKRSFPASVNKALTNRPAGLFYGAGLGSGVVKNPAPVKFYRANAVVKN